MQYFKNSLDNFKNSLKNPLDFKRIFVIIVYVYKYIGG